MPTWLYKKGSFWYRFWEKVAFLGAGPDDCWEWRGAKVPHGYGKIGVDGKMLIASRVSWELANWPIPDELWVLHHCDNPACVNPRHLFLGAQTDNMRDMDMKGRRSPNACGRGERNGHAKLTEPDVHKIRHLLKAGHTQRKIASIFGVAHTSIGYISTGKCWGWLTEA